MTSASVFFMNETANTGSYTYGNMLVLHDALPISAENLAKLAAAMTRAYNRSSVALFTLVIPEQDLSGGIVTVASAEGYVGSVTLSGERESGPAPPVAKMASTLVGRRPLPRAPFERPPGNNAAIPGLTRSETPR